MSEFDGRAYERQQMLASEEAARTLRGIVVLDKWGNGPVIEFTCPRNHSLKRYRAQEYEDTLILMALPGQASKTGATVSNASPWQRVRGVCEVPGCPNLLPCQTHEQQSEELDHVRSGFTCRRCSPAWSDGFTMARLLRVYGAAVALGLSSVPVTFSEATARRSR